MHLPEQQSVSTSQIPLGTWQQVPFLPQGSPLQHSSPAAQEPPISRQKEQKPVGEMPSGMQIPLQHSLSAVQVRSPFGRHTGVVDVEVVLVEVEVEVVLVEVEVVLVVVVDLVQLRHLPLQSQGCSSRWTRSRLLLTQRFSRRPKKHWPVSRSKGTWQMRTQSSSSSARAREGISAAMAVPAMSLSARRRLSEPSASPLARSSKDRLLVCWLTCCPLSAKGGTLGDPSPSLS